MHIEELPWIAPHDLFAQLANEAHALLLDSSSAGPGRDSTLHGRWSFIACDPFDTLRCHVEKNAPDPFAILKARLAALPAFASLENMPVENAPPFIGGVAGFFGYDLEQALERLPPRAVPFSIDDQNVPDMVLGFYDCVLAFDMQQDRCLLVSTGLPEKDERLRAKRARERASAFRRRIDGATREASAIAPATALIRSNFTRAAYEDAVRRVIDYIHAGDIFQANIAQRFEAELAAGDTPYALYLRLRALSPAPFSAFFNFGEASLLSSSPERFLLCDAQGDVETKPIKGTRPRGTTAAQDEALILDLINSEKDRAENVMIVDLLRNDLSKACEDHSVIVEKLCAPESFSTVHHLVSTIRGHLRAGMTPVDLLAGCFPGGSITGAPKLRAMEIIAEIEPTTRGPYCGSIGYIGFDGAMDMSIAIRTMLVKERRVTFQAGGGITSGSDPAAEYEETIAKARAMAAALGSDMTGVENDASPKTRLEALL